MTVRQPKVDIQNIQIILENIWIDYFGETDHFI